MNPTVSLIPAVIVTIPVVGMLAADWSTVTVSVCKTCPPIGLGMMLTTPDQPVSTIGRPVAALSNRIWMLNESPRVACSASGTGQVVCAIGSRATAAGYHGKRTGLRSVGAGMSERPYATIVYGFALPEDADTNFDTGAWETEAAKRAGFTDPRDGWPPYNDWSDEQKADASAYFERKSEVAKESACPVQWAAMFEDPTWHFGIVIGETDWDDPLDLGHSFVGVPDDADKKVAEACEFFGIEPKPCRLWLLAGLG